MDCAEQASYVDNDMMSCLKKSILFFLMMLTIGVAQLYVLKKSIFYSYSVEGPRGGGACSY